MDLVEIIRDDGIPPRYILYEDQKNALNTSRSYQKGEMYCCVYKLECDFAGKNQRTLKVTPTNEFKFTEGKTELNIKPHDNISFSVLFSPGSADIENFQLIVHGIGRQPPISILNRKLNVKDFSLGPIDITVNVRTEMPKMEVGQKQKVAFKFENIDNRDATGISILIKEKELEI